MSHHNVLSSVSSILSRTIGASTRTTNINKCVTNESVSQVVGTNDSMCSDSVSQSGGSLSRCNSVSRSVSNSNNNMSCYEVRKSLSTNYKGSVLTQHSPTARCIPENVFSDSL